MLADLQRDLDRQSVGLFLAHDLGQVRDVLRRAGVTLPHVHPNVAAAVQAANAFPGPAAADAEGRDHRIGKLTDIGIDDNIMQGMGASLGTR